MSSMQSKTVSRLSKPQQIQIQAAVIEVADASRFAVRERTLWHLRKLFQPIRRREESRALAPSASHADLPPASPPVRQPREAPAAVCPVDFDVGPDLALVDITLSGQCGTQRHWRSSKTNSPLAPLRAIGAKDASQPAAAEVATAEDRAQAGSGDALRSTLTGSPNRPRSTVAGSSPSNAAPVLAVVPQSEVWFLYRKCRIVFCLDFSTSMLAQGQRDVPLDGLSDAVMRCIQGLLRPMTSAAPAACCAATGCN
ncbi:unnamed protein product, partial [Phaeothamnion confervicola]